VSVGMQTGMKRMTKQKSDIWNRKVPFCAFSIQIITIFAKEMEVDIL